MTNFLYALKNQATILSLLLLLSCGIWLLYKFKKRKAANILLGIAVVIFLLSSTSYLPRYLAIQLEKKYLPFNERMVNNTGDKFYIHVLGSGNNLDKRLPANSQLGFAALGRLAEAIRIERLLKNSRIICSGNSMIGLETQASVTKRAAVVLGVDSNRVERLDTPTTTKEEAAALRMQYGNKIKVIIVSDALHLPRAMELFANEGLVAIAAPTNYKVPIGPSGIGFGWWPSTVNINLMDIVLHEYLGRVKAFF